MIAAEGTWVGSFVLPLDVTLAASEGERVVLKGDGSANPVLTVMGGARSSVRNLQIDTSGGPGVVVDPGPANLMGVSIAGARKAALTASCTRGACEGETVVQNSQLTTSATGLIVSGARVRVEGGRIAQIAGTGLTDGSGVVAFGGAHLTMNGVTVEDNQAVGVLVDGSATHAALTNCVVKDNRGRGVWIQRATDGGVSITGGEVTGNALVGLGARDSAGLTFSGVTVQDTKTVRVNLDLVNFEDVGDGVGLFTGVNDVKMEGVICRRNARAQILVDEIGPSIRVGTPDVSGGLFRVVVQRTSATVEVPAALLDSPGRLLTVENSAQSVP
ncbi:MAG: hypothetical protein H6Q89_514 [Myxococcaceae bacterium]|nr:hypothetical protein [Myxococcaceae bacterium]